MLKRIQWWFQRRAYERERRRAGRHMLQDPLELLVDMLARFEGFRANAYMCSANVWTFGYGCTRRPDGRPVEEGDNISKAAARKLLTEEAQTALDHAKVLTDGFVPTPGCLAAIASLIYNVGPAAVGRSKFLAAWKRCDMETAEVEFLDFNKAAGHVLEGLTNRRKAEWAVLTGKEMP